MFLKFYMVFLTCQNNDLYSVILVLMLVMISCSRDRSDIQKKINYRYLINIIGEILIVEIYAKTWYLFICHWQSHIPIQDTFTRNIEFFSFEFKHATYCLQENLCTLIMIINVALENSFVPFWIQPKSCFFTLEYWINLNLLSF